MGLSVGDNAITAKPLTGPPGAGRSKMDVACVAPDKSGGRCREWAEANGRCWEHRQTTELAPNPTTILVKFEVVGQLLYEALTAGIPLKRRDETRQQQINESHRREAEVHGRDFHAVRGPGKRGDSGTEVFKGGVRNALPVRIPRELKEAGYIITDLHVMKRPEDKERGFVVVSYASKGTMTPLLQEVTVRGFLLGLFAHVWAKGTVFENIPKPDGTVLHTTNYIGGSVAAEGKYVLFGNGHWAIA